MKTHTARSAGFAALALWLGGAGMPGQAETITGHFRYIDPGVTNRPIAIAWAKVEIHSYRARGIGFWSWGLDETVWTDADGWISVERPFSASGVVYGVKVFAENYAAIVWPNDVVHTVSFHREPGEDDGAIINRTVQSASDTVDFSYDFHDWSAQHYNIAETLRLGFDYATARRDPAETDPLPRVNAQPTDAANVSWYNYLADTLVIHSRDVFHDAALLHEYAHFLQEQISSFAPVASFHDGCTVRDLTGALINTPELAWMEGFADFFAAAVNRSLPVGTLANNWDGTASPAVLEDQPSFCAELPSSYASEAVELRVGGVLWDLVDAGSGESFDTLANYDQQIFQIFDRELDIYGVWPTIMQFRDAWLARGLPRGGLLAILQWHGMALDRPYTLNCPDNPAVTLPPGECSMEYRYALPTASDDLPGVSIQCWPPPGVIVSPGTFSISCSATNPHGTLSACVFNVTVTENTTLVPGGQGLWGQYFENANFTDARLTRVDPRVDFQWGLGSPDPSLGPDTFSVRWSGQVVAPYSGLWTFYTLSDDGVRLWVDGKLIINNWTDHVPTEDRGSIWLSAGLSCDLVMEYYENGGQAVAQLSWSGPCRNKEVIPASYLFPAQMGNGTGLLGAYYDDYYSTTLRLTRIDPVVNFNWGYDSPDPSMGADTFSVRWSGQVEPRYSETYTFSTFSDDGVRLWVDGQLVIDNWTDHGPTEDRGSIALSAGQRYDVVLEYYENGGFAISGLFWSSPSQPKGIIPQKQLYPFGPSGRGGLLYEQWDEIGGAALSDLTSNPAFPNYPSARGYVSRLETPRDRADNYGARLRGFLHAPETGWYMFWLAGDNEAQLWLSTDANPTNKRLIASVPGWSDYAEWSKYPEQQSARIRLTAGQRYYVEALVKEEAGGDHLEVCWALPLTLTTTDPIGGAYLSPWGYGTLTPFADAPVGLPGRVEAVQFDEGGEGVAYHDLTAGNAGGVYRISDVDLETCWDGRGGYNLTGLQSGEWLAYSVNVATAGFYQFKARVASLGAGGTFHIELGGVDKTGPLTVPDTGGWQNWQTISAPGSVVNGGTQMMRLVMDTEGQRGTVGNINYLTLETGARISSIVFEKPGQALVLSWNSEEGKRYLVQFRHDLADKEWRDLGEVLGTGGVVTQLDDTLREAPQRFYRLVEVP